MALMRRALSVLVVGLLWPSVPLAAQPLGTFRWQLLRPIRNWLTTRGGAQQQHEKRSQDGMSAAFHDHCSPLELHVHWDLLFVNVIVL